MANTEQTIVGGGTVVDHFINGSIFHGIAGTFTSRFQYAPSEDVTQHKAVVAVTAKYLGLDVTLNTSAANVTNWKYRVGSANGNQLAVLTSSVTGWIQDSTHTDSVSVNDLINVAFVGTSTGPDCNISLHSVTFNSATPTVVMASWNYNLQAPSTAGANNFYPLAGRGNGSTTSETSTTSQSAIESAGTASGLQANITTNTSGSTIKLRKNGSNGNQTISPATSASSTITVDSTHTDSFAATDGACVNVVTSNTLALQGFSVVMQTTTSKQDALTARNPSIASMSITNAFAAASGTASGDSVANTTHYKLQYAVTASSLRIAITNSITGAPVIKSYINGADGNQALTIPLSATTFVLDSTHTDSVSSGTTITTHLTGGTGGLATLISGGISLDDGTNTGVSTETSTATMTFAGITINSAGLSEEIATGAMHFGGVSFAAVVHNVTSHATMTFAGIAFAAAVGHGPSLAGAMHFAGIAFAGAITVTHVKGDAAMHFGGISIYASSVVLLGAPTGQRSFWLFG